MDGTNILASPISVEDDLPEAWRKVIANLELRAGFKLDSKEAPSIADITASIKPPKADPTLVDKAKKVVKLTLTCAQRLSDMLAQVGTLFFGPSKQVMNAVSFVIQICQGTREVFDNLTALMERLSVFLERLGMYFDRQGEIKLEVGIRRGVYRVLEQFITIMALSYKLGRQWKGQDDGWKGKLHSVKGKVQVALKIGAFGDDSGVKGAIIAFERAVAGVSDVQIDEIHRTLSDTARVVIDMSTEVHATFNTTKEIASTVEEMRGGMDEEKTARAVRKFLEIDEKDADFSTRAHRDLPKHIDGTGQWLFEDSWFEKWISYRPPRPSRKSLLTIEGPEGYGKTHLSHAVIERLQELSRQPEEQQLSTKVAYYYFPQSSKRATVNQALRHICWQFANSDRDYMEFLKTLSGDKCSSNDVVLFNALLLDFYSGDQSGPALFIVLDGINHADEDSKASISQIAELLNLSTLSENALKIRLWLTGNGDEIESLRRDWPRICQSIDLGIHDSDAYLDLPQAPDITRYISAKLKASRIFKDNTSDELDDLKEEILDKLPRAARGNYHTLNRHLMDIIDALDTNDIRESLERLGDDGIAYVTRQIDQLNMTLEASRIRQVNDILAWLSVAKAQLGERVWQSMVSLAHGDAALFDPIDFMRQNCSRLVEIDAEGVMSFRPDAEDALNQALESRTVLAAQEIDMVQAMLKTHLTRTFGEDFDVYQRFDFDGFFNEKRTTGKDLVYLISFKGSTDRMLELCFQILCDVKERDNHEVFYEYAVDKWDQHLIDAVVPGMGLDLKQRLGVRLFRLLREEALIESWASHRYWDLIDWVSVDWETKDRHQTDVFVDWLRDPEVVTALQGVSSQTDWIFSKAFDSGPVERVLHYVAVNALQQWYDDQSGLALLKFLRIYFNKAGPNIEYRYRDTISEWTIAELEDWEAWARATIDTTIDEAQWHIRMAVFLSTDWGSLQKDFLEMAQQRGQKASELEPDNWKARVVQATTFREMEKYQECANILDDILETKQGHIESDEAFKRSHWDMIVPTMAMCHKGLRNHEKAIPFYNMILDKEGYYPMMMYCQAVSDILYCYRKAERYDDALAILDRMNLGRFMANAPESLLHNRLALLAVAANAYERVQSAYTHAEIVVTQRFTEVEGPQIMLAELQLKWFAGPEEVKLKAISGWRKILGLRHNNPPFLVAEALRAYCEALFTRATSSFYSNESKTMLIDPELFTEALLRLNEVFEMFSFCETDRHEIRRMIARLHLLKGDAEAAKDIIRPSMHVAINRARGDKKDTDHQYHDPKLLVSLLTTFGDDERAVAAWSQERPPHSFVRPSGSSVPTTANTSPLSSSRSRSASRSRSRGQHRTRRRAESRASSATAASEPLSQSRQSSRAPSRSRSEERASPLDTKARALPTFNLYVPMWVRCRMCAEMPDYTEEVYHCRDCMDTYLCKICYTKVHAGEAAMFYCNPRHSHVRLPPFDLERTTHHWPHGIDVGERETTREQFFLDLEKDWGLGGWAKAIAGIQRFKILWLQRRRKRQQEALAKEGSFDLPVIEKRDSVPLSLPRIKTG